MTSLKSRFIVSALLAGSAILAGCNSKDPAEDLRGMTDSIAAACPPIDPTGQTRLRCATQGMEHAVALVNYVGTNDQFKRACEFREPPIKVPDNVKAIILGGQAAGCLTLVEQKSGNKIVYSIAREIKNTMQAGLK